MNEKRERLVDKCWHNYLNARNDYVADAWHMLFLIFRTRPKGI
jgi:hypothetical protein